jgi:hypothetical protein
MPKVDLPENLVTAARNLEERFRLLGVPVWKASNDDWSGLSQEVRNLIPGWIPTLLKEFSLLGGQLEYKRPDQSRLLALFSFHEPRSYQVRKSDGSYELYYAKLATHGFIAIASAEGDEWLVRINEGPSSKVYLLDRSSWDFDEPTEQSGLQYAHNNLASLLMTMGVTNWRSNKVMWEE